MTYQEFRARYDAGVKGWRDAMGRHLSITLFGYTFFFGFRRKPRPIGEAIGALGDQLNDLSSAISVLAKKVGDRV